MLENITNYLMDTDKENLNIYETSFVSDPATGFNFLKFKKEDVKTLNFKKVEVAGYQRMVSGVWFMPDTKYIRYDEVNGLYTVEFKKDDLKAALLKYLKSDYANLVKVEHQGSYLEGFISIEHWIYEDVMTLSPIFGLSIYDLGYTPQDLKPGTVLKTIYVSDEQFWNSEIMTGNVTGFSIGGLFNLESESDAVKTYFNTQEAPIVEAPIVSENVVETTQEVVSEPVIETTQDVVSENVVETLQEVVSETVIEEANEKPSEIVSETTNDIQNVYESKLDELSKSFDAKFEALMKSFEDKVGLLSKENASLKEELVNKDTIIEKQIAKIGTQPIKQDIKTVVEQDVNNTAKKRTKFIGGVEVKY